MLEGAAMKRGAVTAVIAILVVASLGIGYFSGVSNRATETLTSIGTSTVTTTTISISTETSVFTQGILVPVSSASTPNPLTGVSLDMNISGGIDGQLFVTVYEFNTLDRVNNVSFGESPLLNSSFFQWLQCDGGAIGTDGYEVLQGDYGLNNFTSGTALWLELQPAEIGAEGCYFGLGGGSGGPLQNDYHTFSSLSDANVLSGAYVGYWSSPTDISTYHPFPPGGYTVVAGDGWGQVTILHFIVAG
jgi:hypothetical protein